VSETTHTLHLVPAAGSACPTPTPRTDGSSALATAPTARPALHVLPEPAEPVRAVPVPPAAVLVRGLLEVLHGWRPVSQVAMRTSPQIAADLLARPRRRLATPPPQVERLRVLRVADEAAEVCAVVRRERRCGALAMRLEHGSRGWIVTRLQVG
jgi:hypothetical protein